MRILAVVVTYNRKVLLARCLKHLEQQKRQCDDIVVINNGSSDGTEAMLHDLGVAVVTQDNVGSAGGWHRGIQYAIDGNYDAVWLMDDDGYPDYQALGLLEKELNADVVCASSVVVCEDSQDKFVFPYPVLDSFGRSRIFVFPRKIRHMDQLRQRSERGLYPLAHLFNGALVSLAAVKTVGNVNCDYFMFGDEVDFYFRLRQIGKVVSVMDALHYHPDVGKRPYTPMKIYYYLKNTLIINHLYMDIVWLRNVLTLFVLLWRTLRRNGLVSTMGYISGKNRHYISEAISRGLNGQIAKDFIE